MSETAYEGSFSWEDNAPEDLVDHHKQAGKVPPAWYVGPIRGIPMRDIEVIPVSQELVEELGLTTEAGDCTKPEPPKK
jgi:hypothetical protein